MNEIFENIQTQDPATKFSNNDSSITISNEVVESFFQVDKVNIQRRHSINSNVPSKIKPSEEKEDHERRDQKIFLNKIFEDQAHHRKKFMDSEKARSDFRIKEDDYNQFNYYESFAVEDMGDGERERRNISGEGALKKAEGKLEDQIEDVSSQTIKETMSPHKIEFDLGLRLEIKDINFQLEAENDRLNIQPYNKFELTSRIQNYFSLNQF